VPVDTRSVSLCQYAFSLTRQLLCETKWRVFGEASDATQHSLSVPYDNSVSLLAWEAHEAAALLGRRLGYSTVLTFELEMPLINLQFWWFSAPRATKSSLIGLSSPTAFGTESVISWLLSLQAYEGRHEFLFVLPHDVIQTKAGLRQTYQSNKNQTWHQDVSGVASKEKPLQANWCQHCLPCDPSGCLS